MRRNRKVTLEERAESIAVEAANNAYCGKGDWYEIYKEIYDMTLRELQPQQLAELPHR